MKSRRSSLLFPVVACATALAGCGIVDDGALDESSYLPRGGAGYLGGKAGGAGSGGSGNVGGAAGGKSGSGGSGNVGGKSGSGGSGGGGKGGSGGVGNSGGSVAGGGSGGFGNTGGSVAGGGNGGFGNIGGSTGGAGNGGFGNTGGSVAGAAGEGGAGAGGEGGAGAGGEGGAGAGGDGGAGAGGEGGAGAGGDGGAGAAGEGGAGAGGEGGAGAGGEGGAGAGGEGGEGGEGGAGAGGEGGAGAGGEGGAGAGGEGGAGAGGAGGFAGSAGAGGGPLGCVDPNSDPASDDDGDGFTALDGDCNDCDPNVNPGAVDIVNYVKNPDGQPTTIPVPDAQQVDEDCSGGARLPADDVSCDGALGPDAFSANDAARAMGLCNVNVPENPVDKKDQRWGVISARFSAISGPFLASPPPASAQPMNLNYGILPNFGAATQPFEGARLFALSSGQARAPGQPGFRPDLIREFDKQYQGAFPRPADFGMPGPAWFPKNGSCGTTGQPHDGVALDLKIRVPTNAKSFSFQFRFFTYEYPMYVCQVFNDVFAVVMLPSPMASGDPMYPDIAFETKPGGVKNVIGVNNTTFLTECTKGTSGFNYPNCHGEAQLAGSGFEGHAASAWLRNLAPVTPGSVISLRFAIWDSEDGILDSTAVVDDFKWRAEEGQLGTVVTP